MSPTMYKYKQGWCETDGCGEPAIGEVCWRVEQLPRVWSTRACQQHALDIRRILKRGAREKGRSVHVFLMVRP
jgi:hypothetical protein